MSDDLLARVTRRGEKNPFWRTIGLAVVDAGEGWARLRLPVTDQLRNGPRASLHGGVLAAVVDAAIASALATLLPEDTEAGALTATLDLNITYIAAVREGELSAEGRILRRGRSIAFGQTDIFDATGDLVATGRATYRIRGTAAG